MLEQTDLTKCARRDH